MKVRGETRVGLGVSSETSPPAEPPKSDEVGSCPPPNDDAEPNPIRDAIVRRDFYQATLLVAQRHGSTLGRFCLALVGTQAEAEQLTRATLRQAFTTFDTLPADASVGVWLLASARRRCAEHLERRRVQRAPGANPGADPAPVDESRAARARSALSKLKPSEREALLLHYLCELEPSDVAKAAGVAEPLARQRLSSGLIHLRTLLAEENAVDHAAT